MARKQTARRRRQRAEFKPVEYSKRMTEGARGLKIGVVKEGFGRANSEADADEKVRAAAQVFGRLGAKVEEVSIPMHALGLAIWLPIAAEGGTQQMMKDNGHGFNWRGMYVTSMVDHHAGWKARADELSDTLKITMILGEYFIQHHRGHYYAKAQNLSRKLAAAYNNSLAQHDLLLMPTLPLKATRLPAPGAPKAEIIARAFEMLPNTAPFDATGHPAMSLPCGMSEGLPIGLMLVGKHFDETTIYRGAYAFEQAEDWKRL